MKKYQKTLLITLFATWSLSSCAQSNTASQQLPKVPEGEPTILLGITGVNSLNSDSTEVEAWSGGGLELVRAFSTQVYPNLRPCPNEIRAAAITWQRAQNLIPTKDELTETKVKLQLWQPDRKGLFEVKYLSKSDGTYARSWLNYYTLTGEKVEVETIEELYETYKISSLWEDLAESMGCFAE